MSGAEFAMRVSGMKKRLEPASASMGPGPKLAVADLAIYGVIEKLVASGETEVAFRELEAALKKDMAWVRKINREGLGNG